MNSISLAPYLIQEGQAILEEINKLQGQRFFYNLFKLGMNSQRRTDLSAFERVLSPYIDIFANIKIRFAQWSLQCDVELARYKKTPQISSFKRERNKLQRMLDSRKPNGSLLVSKMNQVLLLLDSALRTAVLPLPKPKKIGKLPQPKVQRAIVVEKGRPFSALKELEEIFVNAKSYIKVIDKWVNDRSLDFFWRAPNIPIRILTSVIEEKSIRQFEIAYRRMREERGNTFEVRKCDPKELHDRYIITGNDFWTMGPSLKDAGSRTEGSITEITNQQLRIEIEKRFDELWKKSSPIDV